MHSANTNDLAPVAVYTYTRYDHLVRTLESLRQNYLAPASVLYVVSDGARNETDAVAVNRIRDYVDGLDGFKEIVRVYRDKNFGLRQSPPLAEQMILADHGRIINMEDDNITSRNYLDFLNAGLQHFEADETAYSVCGYCPPVASDDADGDFWRFPWNLSWGYGVWKRKHDRFHPLQNRYPALRRSGILSKQNSAGGLYISDSLRRDFLGQKYFPDAILCTEMFMAGMSSVIPTISKVRNVGQDGSGQSSQQVTGKYDVVLDGSEQRSFDFDNEAPAAKRNGQALIDLYNGSRLTRLARKAGVYHQLTELRARLLRVGGV